MRALFVTLRVLLFTAGVILLIGAALAQQAQRPAAPTPAPMTAPTSAMALTTPSNPMPVATTGRGATVPTSATKSSGVKVSSAGIQENESDLLIEGEKRFATNCGRCHQSPHHFPPRMMATIVRHMRVRATITDDDMRLILRYMTQ